MKPVITTLASIQILICFSTEIGINCLLSLHDNWDKHCDQEKMTKCSKNTKYKKYYLFPLLGVSLLLIGSRLWRTFNLGSLINIWNSIAVIDGLASQRYWSPDTLETLSTNHRENKLIFYRLRLSTGQSLLLSRVLRLWLWKLSTSFQCQKLWLKKKSTNHQQRPTVCFYVRTSGWASGLNLCYVRRTDIGLLQLMIILHIDLFILLFIFRSKDFLNVLQLSNLHLKNTKVFKAVRSLNNKWFEKSCLNSTSINRQILASHWLFSNSDLLAEKCQDEINDAVIHSWRLANAFVSSLY